MDNVAFDPNNAYQVAFLSALAKGETGKSSKAWILGVGGFDLSGKPVDEYGFPQWDGGMYPTGPSHAAGTYQFQPGTWKPLAKKYGLNFQNPHDQAVGAWYYAQQRYRAVTGKSLQTALEMGEISSIEQALYNAWPSVFGNSAAKGGLSQTMKDGSGTDIYGGGGAGGGALNVSGSSGGSGDQNNVLSGSFWENKFIRGGMIILGGIIILVSLWQLLSSSDIVSSPQETFNAVAKAV